MKGAAVAFIIFVCAIAFLGFMWFVGRALYKMGTGITIENINTNENPFPWFDWLLTATPIVMLFALVIWTVRKARGEENI